MKFKVSYYDYDTDKYVTKDCDRMDFSNGRFSNEEFHFYPVDNPVKIYKAIIIDHPKVTIHQSDNRIKMSIIGYQWTGKGGYERTETIIENVRED